MNISILAVGTELLMGKTVNTNAAFLSEEINALGHNVLYHLTVGDNPERLKNTLEYLLSQSDMVITTGGLGPTQDDLTKETIASVLNKELIRNEQAYQMMLDRFKNFQVTMTKNNVKQADLPDGCIPMFNQKGTAPGFISSSEGKYVAALPGPPREMKHMFNRSLKLFLEEQSDSIILSEYINLFGIGESSAESLIDDIVSMQSNPTIALYAKPGQVSIRVTAKAPGIEEAYGLIQTTLDLLTERLEPYIIGFGEDHLVDVTIDMIKNSNCSISVAESCTGGLLASTLISKPGASTYFDRGFVTYSNESKNQILNVSYDILDQEGAVSEACCGAMLEGLYGQSFSDICVTITGIAGPGGGSIEKPVGTVYIGVLIDSYFKVEKFNFTGDRQAIQQRTLLNAFNMIRQGLKSL